MKLAYLVGIEEYLNLSPALWARNDAERLGETLIGYCGFEPDRIEYSTAPTDTGILAGLTAKRGSLRDADTFLFYFAGHGLHRRQKSFLLGYDHGGPATRKGASLDQVIAAALDVGAGQTMVICDCCRNLPEGRSVAGSGEIPESMGRAAESASRNLVLASRERPRYLAILLGCSPRQRAWADEENRHGAFTAALLLGLRGNAAAGDGSITVNSLADYVGKVLEDWTRRNPSKAMTPHFTVHGRIMLTPPAPPSPTRVEAPPQNFQFSTGERVPTIEPWLEWLLDHPYSAATEIRNSRNLASWLGRFIGPLAAAPTADALISQSGGFWKELRAFAFRANVVSPKLTARLGQAAELVETQLRTSLSPSRYFSELAAFKAAAQIDPHSKEVAEVRARLDSFLRSIASGTSRQDALRHAVELIAGRAYEPAVCALRAIHTAAPLSLAETGGIHGCDGPPQLVVRDRAEFVRIPAGIFRTSSGRVAGLNSFLVSTRPVAVREYLPVSGRPAAAPRSNPRLAFGDHPIMMVGWHEAERHCSLRGGRLPSEAQWEFARLVAGNQAVWADAEWCADVFHTRTMPPAMDPCECQPSSGEERRLVREMPESRIGRRPVEMAEGLTFRLVLRDSA